MANYFVFKRRVAVIAILAMMFPFTVTAESPSTPSVSKHEYLMGVFPYLSPRELEKMYAPVAADFSKAVGKDVLFMTSSTFEIFMSNLDKQMYDIVFVQPFDYVAIADKYGYRPLATRNKPLPAVILVQPDSEVRVLEDLRGKTLALPPSVAAISYMVKSYLERHGIDPAKDLAIEHHRSHASCMSSVVLGNAVACGSAPPAQRFFQAKMKTELRVIAQTEGIPNSIFAVHPRVSEVEREQLVQQVLSWPSTEAGKALLDGVKVEAFVTIDDEKYDVVRIMSKKYR